MMLDRIRRLGADTAIYGVRGSNGVIIITTKRGQSGSPKFTLTQRFGQFRLANKLGQRRFTDSADAVTFPPVSGTHSTCGRPTAGAGPAAPGSSS